MVCKRSVNSKKILLSHNTFQIIAKNFVHSFDPFDVKCLIYISNLRHFRKSPIMDFMIYLYS